MDEIIVTLRRPVSTTNFTEDSAVDGPDLLPGLRFRFEIDSGYLIVGLDPLDPLPDGCAYVPEEDLLLGAAEEPCKYLTTDCAGSEFGGDSWFTCRRYSEGEEKIPVCQGDLKRCPFKEAETP